MLSKRPADQNPHNKTHSILLNFLESFSLPVFLIYAQLIEKISSKDWLGPYFLGTTFGLMATATLIFFNKPLNRVFIGIHLYFLSGLVAVVLEISFINQLYGTLAAAGMLVWIALACMGSLILTGSLHGNKGSRPHDTTLQKPTYINLGFVILTIVCAYLSWLLQGNRLLAEFVPFMVIFIAYGQLKSKTDG